MYFQFVAAGGLQQLLEIFNSGILEPKEQESWTVVGVHSPFLSRRTFFLFVKTSNTLSLCYSYFFVVK